ncbi:hypothetical protein [Chryseobacterium oncorhynchi]|uniref:Uncharacterized protein n=1 Tax=Chryseobacterium oncorhynchi TaxID=741074 RepID=A0A316X2Q9_9FLAO|nr:hypothetical protein [Chryseobacterium oncorhynchi]PWN67589.1 hypothetical protein C1638_003085 [Chryseobacterium oncorhynchi]
MEKTEFENKILGLKTISHKPIVYSLPDINSRFKEYLEINSLLYIIKKHIGSDKANEFYDKVKNEYPSQNCMSNTYFIINKLREKIQ